MELPAARFRVNEPVEHTSTREMGLVLEEPIADCGLWWYKVRFNSGKILMLPEMDVDAPRPANASLTDLLKEGRFGEIAAFRRALATERLSHQNRSTIYSFRAHRIEFHAYQYKPLLKLLDSPDRRLLIADEVGLGKTIEAGLILTEIDAREKLNAVIVLCPSRLREKWQKELAEKFNQIFTICDRARFLQALALRRDRRHREPLKAIVSIETARHPEIIEALEKMAECADHWDLVIVDEAHHARNPGTQVTQLIRKIGDPALTQAMILLTATPLHLGTDDLHTLLSHLAEGQIGSPAVFKARLEEQREVIAAAGWLRTQNPDVLDKVRRAIHDTLLRGRREDEQDPLAREVVRGLLNAPPQSKREWVELERKVQDLHPLASLLTRTRKRDVQEEAPVRRSEVLHCRFTEEERALYDRVVGAGQQGWFRTRPGLGQIQRARQAASCLPAAALSHSARACTNDDDAHDLTDILPGDLSDLAQHVERVTLSDRAQIEPLRSDSKYAKLIEILARIDRDEPGEKILVFTYFKGTTQYLERRLNDDGWMSLRIDGDVPSDPARPDHDERGKRLKRFRSDPKIRVMVSSEVGSEGLDFQFAHYVINYDLPWNPMVVEQRIGRVDRFGQESAFVQIFSLVVEGSIEERVLARLYERIGIFEQSLGDLETIIGESFGALQRDYVLGKLTPEEAERRAEEVARAVENKRLHSKELELKASNLFGHDEYIQQQLEKVQHLGRHPTEASLLALIDGYLQLKHPGVHVWAEDEKVYCLRLTDTLVGQLRLKDSSWRDRSRNGELSFTTDGELAHLRQELDMVNSSHPLIRLAVEACLPLLEDKATCLGHATLRLPADATEAPGLYLLLVHTLEVEGIRPRRLIEVVGWSIDQEKLIDQEVAERLMHLALESGESWDGELPEGISSDALQKLDAQARAFYKRISTEETAESEARFFRRLQVLQLDHELRLNRIRRSIESLREKGRDERMVRLQESQIAHQRERLAKETEKLEALRHPRINLHEPLAGCLLRVHRET